MDDLFIGKTASFSKTISEADVYSYAGICGDFNPIHIDAVAAAKSRFGSRVCHGMLVNSFISTVLGMYMPGPGTIYLEQNSKFVAPVYIGDTVTAIVTVLEINKRIVKLETKVVNQQNKEVLLGTAVVLKEGDEENNENK